MENRHHRRSIRLQNYDYSQSGYYFITICSFKRNCIFGTIVDSTMKLNEYGKIVDKEIINTEKIRPNIAIDKYVVMPNHVHIIIDINNETDRRGTVLRAPTSIKHAPTSIKHAPISKIEKFGKPTTNSIPTIIRSLKATITKQINEKRNVHENHVWQRNYFEKIIKDDVSLNKIRYYIQNNPNNWNQDSFYE